MLQPRREEDRVDLKKHKEIKEKLRRHKEREAKKMRRSGSSSSSSSSSKSKSYTKHAVIAPDMSPTQERKIKDAFRSNMANVIVWNLNPYRKNDCQQGRITSTDDFKHLARKVKKNNL